MIGENIGLSWQGKTCKKQWQNSCSVGAFAKIIASISVKLNAEPLPWNKDVRIKDETTNSEGGSMKTKSEMSFSLTSHKETLDLEILLVW